MLLKTDYFFKVDGGSKTYYCCFSSHSFSQAYRNCLFACFSDEVVDLRERGLTAEERYQILFSLYGDRVQESTEEMYNLRGDEE